MSRSNEAVIENSSTPLKSPPPPKLLRDLLADTGIQFNGHEPWDIQILDDETYRRVLAKGSLGFGEAYMDGLWECEQLDELITRLLSNGVSDKVRGWTRLQLFSEAIRRTLFNPQSSRRAFQIGEKHYDIGNELFEAMLDPSMSYSCGYWANANSLEQAQQHKLDLICRKLDLKEGEWLLDIGCGWGGLAQYAAEHYGVAVTGITVSREQMHFARDRCAGLPVYIELMDYRDIKGSFNKIVSVGMFEHVGIKNYSVFFNAVHQILDKDGLFLLQTIGDTATSNYSDPWIDKYIFPNGKIPSSRQISTAMGEHFLIEDWHNFGLDYDRTLMAWWDNFNVAWPQLMEQYDERFYRMWKYYLMSCAGYFRSRQGQLWQLVLSKPERKGVYRSVR